MDKVVWSNANFIAAKCSPLATFAMFAEATASKIESTELKNISRPTTRDNLPAEQTPTGKEPAILKNLAEKKSKKPRITSSLSNFMEA
jgi:hypothetical protein